MGAGDSHALASRRLSCSHLEAVIGGLLSRSEMVRGLSKAGFSIRGLRLEKVPRHELAHGMADLFLEDSGFGRAVAARLDDKTLSLKTRLAGTSPSRFVKSIGSPEKALLEGELSAVTWALATDPRKEADRVIARFLARTTEAVEHVIEGGRPLEKDIIESPDLDADIPPTPRPEVREATRQATRAESKARRGEKKLKELRRKREEQARRIASLEADRARLRKEKQAVEEKNEELARRLEKLERWRPEVQRAEQRVRSLEKELGRLEHELGRARRQIDETQRLASELAESESARRALEGSLEEAQSRAEEERFTYAAVTSDLREEVARLRAKLAKERERRPLASKKREYRDQRVGIFLDISNLYLSGLEYYCRQIDYERLTAMILNGRNRAAAIAYNVESSWGDKSAFFEMLRRLEYEIRTKDLVVRADGSRKGDWDVGMAADIVERLDQLDVVALGSGDGDFLPILQKAHERGVATEVYAFPNTALVLKQEADYFPIDESVLVKEVSRFARPEGSPGRAALLEEIRSLLGAKLDFLGKLSPRELELLLSSLRSR